MCRLAAFPPGFSRNKALDILLEMECMNTDGTGFSYVKDSEIVTKKWPKDLSDLLKKDKPVLSNMPYDGWTIAHLRLASHGANLDVNTHPFNIGDWAICHNGIWSDYWIAKLALEKYVNFEGDTDSEVAGHMINNIGAKRFAEEIDHGGVYLALNVDGSLQVAKTSGDLVMCTLKDNKVLIASELDEEKYAEQADASKGWYHFGTDGLHEDHKFKKPVYSYSNMGHTTIPVSSCASRMSDEASVARSLIIPAGARTLSEIREAAIASHWGDDW